MKRAELIDKLEALPASELAALAGVALKRGRPSNDLREALVGQVLDGIRDKRVSVKRDGTVARRK